tara:strand:+ start:18514 stop:19692 length:1179 start_codon:yes stop_codon:yes gene_type:complete
MYKKINRCLCCDSKNLYYSLNLNEQPLANSYIKDINEEENIFPLGINFCTDCTHIQLTHAVNPDILFRDYLYVSGTTKTGRDYFDWFVEYCQKFTNGKNVLDIACNDGSQLNSFKKKKFNTYGIDPATNLYPLSSKNHLVKCDYLNKESISSFNIDFDIIIAQNVFAHNTYPQEFLNTCKSKLSKNGYIFIQTSQADMIENFQFDTIYHEHISFFSVKSFCALAKKVGLKVINISRTPIHGTSFLFVLSSEGKDKSEEFIIREKTLDKKIIDNYSEKCKEIASNTFIKVDELKANGYKVIGYGAAAKGNTFINFSKINLDYIIDDNPLKHNLFTPGSKIKILPASTLKTETSKLCIIPLAWNFFDEIKQRVNNEGIDKCIFLKYFPELLVTE